MTSVCNLSPLVGTMNNLRAIGILAAMTLPASSYAQSTEVWGTLGGGPGWASSSAETQLGIQWQIDGGVRFASSPFQLGVNILRWSGQGENPVKANITTFTAGYRLARGFVVQIGYGSGRTTMVADAVAETGAAFSLGTLYDHRLSKQWAITGSLYWYRHTSQASLMRCDQ